MARKIIFIFFLLLIGLFGYGQRLQVDNTYGREFKRFYANTLLGLPKDTFSVPSDLQDVPFISVKSDVLYKWNTTSFIWEEVSAGGGGATIYTQDGTIDDAVRTVSLNGNTLTFNQGGNSFLYLQPTAGAEQSLLQAVNITDNGNFAAVDNQTQNTQATSRLTADFNNNVNNSNILLFADASTSTITYTTIQHILSGAVRLNALAGNGTGFVGVDNSGNLSFQSTPTSYTDEEAQDAVGGMVNASLTYTDGTPLLTIADRDNGDITTSLAGLTWTIDNLAVTNAKINDVAVGKITGLGTGVATFLATPSSDNFASALTDEQGSSGGFVRAGSPTITTPTISGAITTTAAAQNGTNASGTGGIPYVHHIIVRSDETLSNTNADQNLFTNTAHDVITVQANTTYRFEGWFDLTHGAVSHDVQLGFLPTTATVTSINYTAWQIVTAVGTQTASQTMVRIKATATTAVNAAGANGTESVWFSGSITIGATGGTITPQIQFSADPTGTILLKAGSEFHIWAIGNDTFTEQGPIN